jgi:hypothetical protein
MALLWIFWLFSYNSSCIKLIFKDSTVLERYFNMLSNSIELIWLKSKMVENQFSTVMASLL